MTTRNEAQELAECPSGPERRERLAEHFHRYKDRLRTMVRLRIDRRIQSRIDPSDVIQEAFLEAAEGIDAYLKSPEISLYLWIRFLTGRRLQEIHRRHLGAKMRDAHREISLYRGSLPQATSEQIAARLIGNRTSPSGAAIKAELRVRLQEALNGMDPIDREVLALRHFEELSSVETAKVLGIGVEAARKRHMRALGRLRRVLARMPGGSEEGWT